MAPKLWRSAWRILLIPASLLLGGCGGDPAPYVPPLEGVILWEDGTEPRELEGARVEFESGGAMVAETGLVGDGTFILDKPLPPGEYRVRVQPPSSAGRVVDGRFEDFEKSGLKYTAPGGSEPQRVNFKLARAGR